MASPTKNAKSIQDLEKKVLILGGQVKWLIEQIKGKPMKAPSSKPASKPTPKPISEPAAPQPSNDIPGAKPNEDGSLADDPFASPWSIDSLENADIDKLDINALKALCDMKGIEYHHAQKEKSLRKLLRENV